MNLAEITKRAGRTPQRKRVGRGPGSGLGKTAGRGHKGAKSRAGFRRSTFAEGGQMPLFRRVPKRGFNNFKFRTTYSIVNVADLEARFDAGAHVTPQTLAEAGLVRRADHPVKVLGNGDLTKKLVVEAARFSQSAAEKIAAAGGEARVAQGAKPPE